MPFWTIWTQEWESRPPQADTPLILDNDILTEAAGNPLSPPKARDPISLNLIDQLKASFALHMLGLTWGKEDTCLFTPRRQLKFPCVMQCSPCWCGPTRRLSSLHQQNSRPSLEESHWWASTIIPGEEHECPFSHDASNCYSGTRRMQL